MGATTRLTWQVTGMDCAACVAKVTRAVERLPGVSAVEVNLMAERLSLRLDAAAGGGPEAVEAQVAGLGYAATRLADGAPGRGAGRGPARAEPPHGHDQAREDGHAHGHDDARGHAHGRNHDDACGHDCDHAGRHDHDHASDHGCSGSRTHDRADGHGCSDDRTHDHARGRGRSDDRPYGLDRPPANTDTPDRQHTPGDNQTASGRPHHDHAYHHAHDDDPADARRPWWATGRARLVWVLGALVLGAYALSLALPERLTYPLFLLATGIALVPFGRRALALARAGSPFSIETLMVTAALGAAVIGAAEESAVVVLLFAAGELLETVAAGRARQGIRALAGLMPRVALRLRPDGGTEETAPERLAVGDLVLIRPGDRVPCDGTIEEGRSALDESPVTGESIPVARGPGDAVMAGSINADGAIRVRVARAAQDNTIARIIRLVEDATASRAPSQRFVERFAAWWTPAAMLVALLVVLVPPVALGWDWWTSLYRGLAVLLIACPCALVISVPAALASGLSAGARRGLLVKGGAALEAIGAARTVAFDKTGTLTEGRPRVTDVIPAEGHDAREVLALAAAIEHGSAHPLARAILEAAAERGISPPPAEAQSAIPGRAVAGTVDGRPVTVGSPRHAREEAAGLGGLDAALDAAERDGKTVAVVTAEGAPVGLIGLRDTPRPDAAAGIAALAALGVRPVMLTGDNRRAGAAIGGLLGLEARAGLLPDDKLQEIARLREAGPVVMVGDGINDAPALAAADVGVAMGGGTDVALEAADAAVLRDRVAGVAELVALSRATMTNVKQNVAVAIGLKGVFLVTTLAGVTGLWPAVLADTGATVLVTLNALRLLRWRPAG